MYDKKLELVSQGLKLNKFPDPASKLSTRCKYGVITSQLNRYDVVCTTAKHFLEPAGQLYKAYVVKGYKVKKIDHYFKQFIRRHNKGDGGARGLQPGIVKWFYQKYVGNRMGDGSVSSACVQLPKNPFLS